MKYIPIFLILILFSCNQKSKNDNLEKKEYYYPEKGKFEQSLIQKNIFIDSIENYGELLTEIDKIACQDSIPIINYSNREERFKLLPWYECSESNIVSCPTFRSRIFIQNDSILTNYEIRHSIDSLDIILERHLLNKGKDFNYSDSPDRAGIEIYFKDDVESKKIKKLLLNLSERFNYLNDKNPDTLYLNVYFRDRALMMIPPPPPPKPN